MIFMLFAAIPTEGCTISNIYFADRKNFRAGAAVILSHAKNPRHDCLIT